MKKRRPEWVPSISSQGGGAFCFALLFAVLFLAEVSLGQSIIADPSGDVSGKPDIVSVSAGCTHSHLVVSAAFASGTMSVTNFGFYFFLDADRNTNTSMAYMPPGTDHLLRFNPLVSTSQVVILRGSTILESVPITFGPDTFRFVVPLTRVGNTNGVMNFALGTGTAASTSLLLLSDFAPDSVWPPGTLGGPSSVIPELRIARGVGHVIVSWLSATNFVLEAATAFPSPGSWVPITNAVTTQEGENVLTDACGTNAAFYRLRK